ncbi:LAGLIDADG family homing endonuclease [Pyrococcus abyssi]|nr:LAGLIDADG family homing endonuclease [Pyrococcus abyssi]CCE69486.1 TPA: replication factor C small subunit [Pyrococcus abyssi GE5]
MEEVREVKVLEKPWVEKYRPQKLEEIVGQEHIVKRLKHYVKTGSMPHLLFAGPPGVGKCLTGDAKVIANGELTTIGELVERISNGKLGPTPVRGLTVLGIDEDGKLVELPVEYVYKDKTSELVKIRTRLGRELKVTPYHPLLVNRRNGKIEWVKAEELKPGDRLAIPSFLPAMLNDNPLAEWLGYFFGNGYTDSEERVVFESKSKELRKRFMELTRKLFQDAEIKEDSGKVYVSSSEVKRLVKSLNKDSIPEQAWKGLRSFLRAYFDCNAEIKDKIIVSTAGKEIAEQISYALAGLGIVAEVDDKGSVIISDPENVSRFLDEIGFSVEEKKEEAKALIKKSTLNLGIYVDKELISYVREKLKLSFYENETMWSPEKAREIAWKLMKEIYYRLDELERFKKALSKSVIIDWSEVEKKKEEISEKTGISVNEILEYAKGKRKPSLEEYVKIAKALGVELKETLEAIFTFGKKYLGYVISDEIETLEEVRKEELKRLKELLNDEKLKKGVAYLIFLAQNELLWDEIIEVEKLKGDFVIYDLHVPKYHNFIGGNLPTVLHNTTAALALARELFGENWRHNFLELNASDERGINVIREKVKEFARTKPIGGASFKIIFLDEADALTQDAQQALRRTMEMFSSNVRFILSCVTGDTKVYTPDEREVKIRDFMNYFENGLIKEVSNRIGRDTVIAAVSFNSRIVGHPVYRLTLESGRIIEATGDHMFLTPEGWKQTYDIKEGSEVLVKPTLEGTPYEPDPRVIIDIKEFYNFLEKIEREHNLKPLKEAKTFRELITKDKEKILRRALELRAEIENGLTKREAEILELISADTWIPRAELEKKARISRTRLNQILQRLEKKGYIERRIEGRKQFVRKIRNGKILRNAMDIKRILEEEFGIKISYTTVKKLLSGNVDGMAYRILKEVKEKWLVRYDDEKAGILARVVGFILGDGHLARNGRIWFNSSKEELEMLANDLRKLGLKPSEIIERDSSSEIQGRKVKGRIYMLYVDNAAFHALLRFWKVEVGNKTKKGYTVPEWIKKGNLFVKREFLRGLFGADGTKPCGKRYNFNGIKLEIRAKKESLERTVEFLNDVADLLREFDVDSKITVSPTKEGFIIRLIVTPNDANYLNFLTRVGYAYAKDTYARLVGEYIRIKLAYKNIILPGIAEKAIELATVTNSTYAAKVLGVSRDFVVNRLKGTQIGITRDFMTFEEFMKERVLNGYVIEKVIKKEKLGYLDVYDVTCARDHSFISNGLVSHNCNYSSKIIEPIQSRCAIFRFRPLNDEDIAKRLRYIAENEGLELTEEGLQAILYIAEGDMRRAINILQAAAALDRKITDENVFLVASRARPEDIREMMLLALKGNFLKAREKLREILLKQGLSGEDVLVQMHREVFNLPIDEPMKVYLADKIGEYNFRLVEGANEMIQLEALLAQFTLIGKKK